MSDAGSAGADAAVDVNSTNSSDAANVLRNIEENPAFLIALAFMVVAATAAQLLAGRRVKLGIRKALTLEELPGLVFVGASEAAQFPVTGSLFLFSLYVGFKVLGKWFVNLLLTAYLALASVTAQAMFWRPYVGANLLTGSLVVALGAWYVMSKHWILNNILAFGVCVVGIEAVPLKTFSASAFMLCGLFLYDVFWVFGTDVMVTVAKNVDGPIKILFPQDIFGDHEKKSLLGLGDIVIPGLFIVQMLRFGHYSALKRGATPAQALGNGTAYYKVALVAYVLSLVNTMGVMVFFNAAQPALLYIVPWLLVTALLTALVRGEWSDLVNYDEDECVTKLRDFVLKDKPELVDNILYDAREAESAPSAGILEELFGIVLQIFGLDAETRDSKVKRATA